MEPCILPEEVIDKCRITFFHVFKILSWIFPTVLQIFKPKSLSPVPILAKILFLPLVKVETCTTDTVQNYENVRA